MLLFAAAEVVRAYYRYKNAKADGLLPVDPQPAEQTVVYEPKPLSPDTTRFERALHWLGIEETEE